MNYTPSAVQAEFHALDVREAMIGGSAGPGKSLALLMDPMQQLMVEDERWRNGEISRSVGWAIHFRREFPMLDRTIERSRLYFQPMGAKYDSNRHLWEWPCGYKLQFASLKDDDDWQKFMSNDYTHIACDEIIQLTKEQYINLEKRCRTDDPVLMPMLKVRSATNPAPNWVREYFVDPAPEGRTILRRKITLDDGTTAFRDRIFIPALLTDNPDPAFRRDYEITLQALPAGQRQALLYGDWYITAGAFYAGEWDPSVHVCKPFKIPSGWTKFRSGDWGFKNPGTVLWWAIDPDGNMVCYRELTFQGLDVEEVGKKIKQIEMDAGEWDQRRDCSPLSGPMDTQFWTDAGAIGPTMDETMAKMGVYWEKCTKNKIAAVQEFIRRLRDKYPAPGIRFFNTCQNCIRTIPALGTDKNEPELPQDGGPDHWHDAVMYAVMGRKALPKRDYKPTGDFGPGWPRDEVGERRTRTLGRYGYGGR